MSVLTTKKRDSLPAGQFGISRTRQYPVFDASHAANAKARAAQQLNAGNLSPAQKATIDRKANNILAKGK